MLFPFLRTMFSAICLVFLLFILHYLNSSVTSFAWVNLPIPQIPLPPPQCRRTIPDVFCASLSFNSFPQKVLVWNCSLILTSIIIIIFGCTIWYVELLPLESKPAPLTPPHLPWWKHGILITDH